jgi:ribonuclease R
MIDKMIIKTQQQAKYEASYNPHFALGFEKYTHFTSPIRRYSDLTLHRLLKSIIHQNQKFHQFILRNIESLVVKISELEREVMKIEWDFYDRKFARWANERVGNVVKGVIIDSKFPPIAKIDDEIVGARVFLKGTKKVELFEKVNIKIISVNLATTKIRGEIEE